MRSTRFVEAGHLLTDIHTVLLGQRGSELLTLFNTYSVAYNNDRLPIFYCS